SLSAAYNDSLQAANNEFCTPGKYFTQDDGSDVRNNPKRSCQFNRTVLEDCSGLEDQYYGYRNGQPCVLIKLNRVIGMKPGDGEAPFVTCTGKKEDSDKIGPIAYFPPNGTFNLMYYPYYGKHAQVNYSQPLVAVKFLNLTMNTDINIECRIMARNIKVNNERDKFAGRKPCINTAIYEQKPCINTAIYEQKPCINTAIYEQKPCINTAIYEQKPCINTAIYEINLEMSCESAALQRFHGNSAVTHKSEVKTLKDTGTQTTTQPAGKRTADIGTERKEAELELAMPVEMEEKKVEMEEKKAEMEEKKVEMEEKKVEMEEKKVEMEEKKVEMEKNRVEKEKKKVEMEKKKVEMEKRKVEMEKRRVEMEKQFVEKQIEVIRIERKLGNDKDSKQNDKDYKENDKDSKQNDKANKGNDKDSKQNDKANRGTDKDSKQNDKANKGNDKDSNQNDKANRGTDKDSKQNDKANRGNDSDYENNISSYENNVNDPLEKQTQKLWGK
ncbi:Sodium/potassium-transporting ATPase subunit beta-2, partial [Acipenser ruthenus]